MRSFGFSMNIWGEIPMVREQLGVYMMNGSEETSLILGGTTNSVWRHNNEVAELRKPII